ncbi:SURF1 family protein [Plantactinospora sp. KLBMP9567]|uniref:SURF1 family cytochrome oxidase biogenesis protein n=1 Tax=Plantactinospora sp. KLBMP9567 TaxID=3085900 RepID=UPI002980CBAD|nr:SURF1 family protein [Plantactinospora sp. KLBMP9567]MDW5323602.1 SURF1 family protein [Plantactinospora sp. KLBMP9567]
MYRFLLTPRWLGILALTLAAATVMVLLGNWQLSRYQERAAINERIDETATLAPVPVDQVLPRPDGAAGTVGQAPPAGAAWTRVTVTGRYDSTNVILIRSRTVQSRVGFEVLTPLRLADGSAVLVDRGWIPPAAGGSALARPEIPAVPSGEVTVVGRVHLSESKPDAVARRDGRIETRRIAVPALARELPYPVYSAYLLLDEQTPATDPAFSAIPIRHENDWQNGGYVVQWWLFALLTLVGFGWAARREARGDMSDGDGSRDRAGQDRLDQPAPATPSA